MWQMTEHWWEMILRAALVYAGIFVLFRFTGKKQLGEMSPLDFVLLLIISESVNGGLLGDDKSVPGALISVTTLLVMSALMDRAAFRWRKAEKWTEGEPQVLVRDGRVVETVRRREKITHSEIESALRDHGIEKLEEVKFAVLETNGHISFIKNEVPK